MPLGQSLNFQGPLLPHLQVKQMIPKVFQLQNSERKTSHKKEAGAPALTLAFICEEGKPFPLVSFLPFLGEPSCALGSWERLGEPRIF